VLRVSPTPLPLALLRLQIDLVDRGMRRLLRLRQQVVGRVGLRKQQAGWPCEDPAREAGMASRAEAEASALGLPAEAARELLELSVRHCRPALVGEDASARQPLLPVPTGLLRWLPPPARLAPLLRRGARAPLARGSRQVFQAALAAPLAAGELDPISGRRLAIEASDLGLRWVVEVEAGQIKVLDPALEAEATIRGSATDLLRLAARLEDADTLFFQRALQLTGDVELGLTARNLLDRLPWESVPLALRILLQRAARLAERARLAHRAARAH
jgi:predicted lipid carrier protein YhbT/chorismate mutase